MKTVKITNGEVHLKPFCTRKLRKEINRAMFDNIRTDIEGKVSGMNMADMDNANDVALLGMIEKILIDKKEVEVTIELLDGLDENDYNKILVAINEITNKKIPKD